MNAVKHSPRTDVIPLSDLQEITDTFLDVLDKSFTDEAKLLKHIARTTAKSVGKGEASIFLVTGPPHEKVITYKAGSSDITHHRLNGFQLQIGEGVVGYTIKTGKAQLIADVQGSKPGQKGPFFSPNADDLSDYPTRSLVCAPIIAKDQVIGAIEIVDELPDRFSKNDLGQLSLIANFSAKIIQESRHIQALKRQSKLLDAGTKIITQTMARLDNFEQLLEQITESLHLNLDFDNVELYLLDANKVQDGNLLRLKAASEKLPEFAAGPYLEIDDDSMVGWATKQRKPCIALHFGEQNFRIRYVRAHQTQDEQGPSAFVAGNKLLTKPGSTATLPLTAYGAPVGLILVQNEKPSVFAEENFPDEDINTLQSLIDQLAVIIHHARSYQHIEYRNQSLEIIQDIDQQIIGTTDQNLTENLDLILDRGLKFIEAESGQILGYDERTQTLTKKVATTETYTQEPEAVEGVFEQVILSKKSLVIDDLKFREPGANMNSRLAVPLIIGDMVVGIFNAESPRPKAFTRQHQELIEALAPKATIAIQNAYLFNKKTHRSSLLQAAAEVSSSAIATRDLNDLLHTTIETIVSKFRYYYAAIYLVDEKEPAWVVLRAGAGEKGRKMLAAGYRVRVGSDTPIGQATGPFREPQLASYNNQDYERLIDAHLPGSRSEIALSLSVKTGDQYEVFGALSVHSVEGNAFAKEKDTTVLQAMADQLAVIISHDKLYRQSESERQLVEVLRAIDRSIIDPDESKEDILNFILTQSCQLTRAESGQIFLVGENKELKVEFATESSDRHAKVPTMIGTVIGDAVFNGQILIPDLNKLLPNKKEQGDEPPEGHIDYSRVYKENKRSRAAVRFYEEHSNVVGVLSVEHTEPDQFSSKNVETLSALASQAAIAIKNRTLTAQAKVRTRHLEATALVGAEISSSLNVAELLDKAVQLIRQKFNLYYAGIFVIEQIERKGRKQRMAALKAASSANGHQSLDVERRFEVIGKSMVALTLVSGEAKTTQVALGGGNGAAGADNSPSPNILSKMYLPLRNRKGVIGVLEVQSVATVFTEDDTQTLQTMADQLAIAIYNAELYQHIEQDKQQLAALRDIDLAIIGTELDLDQTLELILTRGLDLIEAKHGSLSLLEPDQEHLVVLSSSQKDEIGRVLPVDKSILGLAVEKQRSIRIADISLEPRYQTDHSLFSGSQIASTLLVPLIENEAVTGVFSAYSMQINAFSDKQQETLETLARQAAIAVKNASLYGQAQRRAALLKAAAQVSQSVISVFDLDQLLDKIVNTICHEFEARDFHYAAVFLVDDSGKYAWQRAGSGEAGRKMVTEGFKYKVDVDDSIVSTVIQSGQGAIQEYNLYPDEPNYTMPLLPNTQSEMALPLKLRNKVIGALAVHSLQRDAFNDEDTQTLQSMADQLAIAIDNVTKQEKLVEAETLKTIDEATSQSMHWVANKARPIKDYIERIDQAISPIISEGDFDESMQEDFFEAIDVIKQNTGLILDVKQEIMGAAREFELVNVKLADVVNAVLKQVDIPPGQIEASIQPELPLVQADRHAIEEVLRNLIVNAFQAMQSIESPELHIKAQAIEPDNFVEVRIVDNGTGIPDDRIKDIWTPFYTTKAGAGGTGVGLSYCLQAMHKMGGKISVDSEVGQGTTFTLMLPIYAAD